MEPRIYVPFLPTLLSLAWILFGLLGAALATRSLRKSSTVGNSAGPAGPPSRRIVWGKRVRAFGALLVVSGLVGLWLTQISLGWSRESPRVWSDGRAPELEPLIRRHCLPFVKEGKTVGMAVAVVSPTHSTVMTFGDSALVFGAPVRDDTVFEIGSITKTFTAILLARAIEGGSVRLEQPIQELLPPGVELPPAARAVTLRHLTTHTSGFPRLPGSYSTFNDLRVIFLGGNPYGSLTEADYWESVRSVKLASIPGAQDSYSNFGVTVLGQLLAARAGTDLETLFRREIFEPLGMRDTAVTPEKLRALRKAQGYRVLLPWGRVEIGLRSSPWSLSSNLSGVGGINSTGRDMLKYLQANMRPEGVPIGRALRESHGELFRESERRATGMNWFRWQIKEIDPTVIWHNGGTGGFRSHLSFTEDGRSGVVILSNLSESVDSLGFELLRELSIARGPFL